MFADVNLNDRGAPKGDFALGPDAGGWPTILYFNQATGATGGKYISPTPEKRMAPCDELGPAGGMLESYIKGAAGLDGGSLTPSWCDLDDTSACSESELEFIQKYSGKSEADIQRQYNRLTDQLNKKGLKKELKDSATQKIALLKRIMGKQGIEHHEL
mmetsp:Transcript_31996/g.38724  ORF Transcript_31996/g.38724 Transcript_31996/m.38724 type:complete len:158 (-) Transcript_31996:388-861(-)